MSPETRRIAVIAAHASPLAQLGAGSDGGLNVYVREMCLALGGLGVETDVFTRIPARERPRVLPMGDRGRVIQVPAGGEVGHRYELLKAMPEVARQISAFPGADGYDAVYSHYWLSGVAALHLRSSLGVPWAHTAHTLGVVKNKRLAPGAEPEPARRIETEGRIARAADLLVVSTAAEGEALEEAYGIDDDRVAVVAPGVDTGLFHPRPRRSTLEALGRAGQHLFLAVGRLERLKGIDIAIAALARLDGHPEARLLIIGGDGGQPGEMERLRGIAASLGVTDRVEFCGPMPQDRLAEHLAAAAACIVSSYSESFGLAGLEALACGTPVLASRGAGMAAVVEDGRSGFLVESNAAEAYAPAMRRLVEEDGLVEELGVRALADIQAFTWRAAAERLIAHLSEVSAEPAGEGDAIAL